MGLNRPTSHAQRNATHSCRLSIALLPCLECYCGLEQELINKERGLMVTHCAPRNFGKIPHSDKHCCCLVLLLPLVVIVLVLVAGSAVEQQGHRPGWHCLLSLSCIPNLCIGVAAAMFQLRAQFHLWHASCSAAGGSRTKRGLQQRDSAK